MSDSGRVRTSTTPLVSSSKGEHAVRGGGREDGVVSFGSHHEMDTHHVSELGTEESQPLEKVEKTVVHDDTHSYRVADSTRFCMFPSLRGVVPAAQLRTKQREGEGDGVVDSGCVVGSDGGGSGTSSSSLWSLWWSVWLSMWWAMW